MSLWNKGKMINKEWRKYMRIPIRIIKSVIIGSLLTGLLTGCSNEGKEVEVTTQEQVSNTTNTQEKNTNTSSNFQWSTEEEEQVQSDSEQMEEEKINAESELENDHTELIQNKAQALEYLKQYLSENGKYIPGYIVLDGMIAQGYNFHGYDDMGDHVATSFWYAVSPEGRIYDGIACEYVDEMKYDNTDDFNDSSEYILPYSDSEYYTYDEIRQLSSQELRIARNEIFARYGYVFNDEGLKAHFSSCSWYSPTGLTSGEIEGILNNFEKQNLQLIQEIENE